MTVDLKNFSINRSSIGARKNPGFQGWNDCQVCKGNP